MTFIKPNKNNFKLIRFFTLAGVLVAGFISLEVYSYSQTVNLKHDIISLGSKIETLRLKNASLKNDFYALTDAKNLDSVAKQRGLIQDNNPKWVFASQF